MKQPPSFALTHIERQSPMWGRLMAHFAEQVELLRNQLEGPKSESDTARLRGRIAELRSVMALNDEVPAALE